MPSEAWDRNEANLEREMADVPMYLHRPWMWATVSATMYVGHSYQSAGAIGELKLNGAFPDPEWIDEDVTNLLWQRYHLWRWQQRNPAMPVGSLRTIVEFGGGYGAMCIVASRLGFRGSYYITDLPQMERMQELHLPGRDLHCNVYHGSIRKPDLLISLFGLGETPVDERDAWISDKDPKAFLFAFLGEYDQANNSQWFSRWAQRQFERNDTLWSLEHGPAHSSHDYLTSHRGWLAHA